MGSALSRSYYFDTVKIIRDIVHGYISLTRFDLELIDTIEFQRLKDIRQLTCQHVYPSARHTRFEHSLGVLELTRQIIKNINRNGVITKQAEPTQPVINSQLQFNAAVAALLHDVGHCPFSHLGEIEFDKEEVRERLCQAIWGNEQLRKSKEKEKQRISEKPEHQAAIEKNSLFQKVEKAKAKNIGAVHEQLSCIIILEKFSDKLSNLCAEAKDDNDGFPNGEGITIDYELILRSILGIEYDVSTVETMEENKAKNIIVRLINSPVFDMDKLDYIMRDSALTGIGTPSIDTQRLFKNTYLNDDYSLIFTSKAVPSLQNMIESRDSLYMYVYNHHVVVFSDFMNTYIMRRLSRNARDFLCLTHPQANDGQRKKLTEDMLISHLGLVPRCFIFSSKSVVDENRSDSDWVSLLNTIYISSIQYKYIENEEKLRSELVDTIYGECFDSDSSADIMERLKDAENDEEFCQLQNRILLALKLIHNYKKRTFLKPWWKTVFEFTSFMEHHFRDDRICELLCRSISNDGEYGLEASELRSQIAKHVIYLTQKLFDADGKNGLAEAFHEGDFFIIERSNRFFARETIGTLEIALKTNEILGLPADVQKLTAEYYTKNLTNLIPQKDYSTIYNKNSFYIFSKPLSRETVQERAKEIGQPPELLERRHYQTIEQIFAFVASEFMRQGEQKLVKMISEQNGEEQSKERMLELYQNQYQNY